MDQDARCSDRRTIQGQQKFQVCQDITSASVNHLGIYQNVSLFAFIFGGICLFLVILPLLLFSMFITFIVTFWLFGV